MTRFSPRCAASTAERVRAAGWRASPVELVVRGRLGNGLPMDDLVRSLWADAAASGREFGDPSSPLAAELFAGWLREPAEQGGAAGVNRYLLGAYRTRPDLRHAFRDLDGADGESLIAWAWDYGRSELGLIPELLPPAPDGIALGRDAELAVNVMGYLRDTLGLAEAARLYIKALRAAGVPVSTTAIAPDLPVDPAKGKTITRFGHHPVRGAEDPVRAGLQPGLSQRRSAQRVRAKWRRRCARWAPDDRAVGVGDRRASPELAAGVRPRR